MSFETATSAPAQRKNPLSGKGITRVHGAMITDADFKQFMQ